MSDRTQNEIPNQQGEPSRQGSTATYLRDQKERILQIWEERTRRSVPAARGMESHSLRNSFPKLINDLIETLSHPEHQRHLQLDEEGAIARDHGHERSYAPAYDLNQMIEEYQVLRQAIFEVLRENGPLSDEETDLILEAITIGIRNASREFSRLRLAQDQDYERRLQQSEERFKILVEGVKDHAIIRTDPNGVIQDWSPGAENITGWKHSEVIGKQGSIIFTPQDLAKSEDKKEMITARETGKAEDNRWHIRKNGSRYFAIGSMNPLRDPTGNLTGYVKVFRDFTEKRREHLKPKEETEQTILSREEMYELIMQAPVAMVLVSGPDHRFILANPPYEKMVGRNVTGKTVLEAFNKEEVGTFLPLLNGVYETGQPYIGTELPLPIPNEIGEIESRFVNLGYHPFRDSNGTIKGIFAVAQDVTEQVLARKRVEQSEVRFRQLANALPLIVWTANSDGYVDWYNDWWYEYLGQPRGTEWDDPKKSPMHPDDVARTKVLWPEAFRTGSPFFIEQRFRRGSDGQYRWHLVRGVPIRDPSGKVIKYAGGNTDIHEQKMLTEQLARAIGEIKEREENFRAIFDRAASGIARVGLDGHWNMVNTRLTEIFEYSASELSAKTFQEMTHPDDIDLELKRIEDMKAGEYNSFSMEKRYRRKDGSYVWVNLTKSLVRDESGVPKSYIAVIEDISTRKRLEEDLQNAKQSADSANQMKTAFLANMSHEIRTPIGVIQGFADLLADESLQSEQRKWVEIIRRNTRQLTSLIGEILDLSKVEADKLEIENIPFRLSELAEDLRSSLTFKAEEKGLAFFVDLDPNLPQFVVSDPTRLRQILINLAGNAIKFTETGFIKVLFKKADSKNQLLVQVCDTGIGLSEEQKKKVFDPFVQADNSMTRRFGGTGLGLSISKKLALALGGDLVISKSKPGFGSIFELTVCCLQNKMEKSSLSDKSGSKQTVDLSGRRILLIEDSPDNRMLIERMLLGTQAEIYSEANGKLGVERATREKFDIVLMDIQMPEMDGYQAIEFLRNTGYDKPVIALTAHALKEERERAVSLGFNGYVTKPILKKSLLRAIQNCLSKTVLKNG